MSHLNAYCTIVESITSGPGRVSIESIEHAIGVLLHLKASSLTLGYAAVF